MKEHYVSQNRQPAGVPVGGQFAPEARSRSGLSLGVGPDGKRFGTVESHAEPVTCTAKDTINRGVHRIDDTPVDDLMARLKVSIGADGQHRRARSHAGAELVRALDGDDEIKAKLRSLSESNSAVTVLVTSTGGGVIAIEGRATVAATADGPKRATLLAKGSSTQGYRLDGDGALDVVAVERGYGHQDAMAQLYTDQLNKVPGVSEYLGLDSLPVYDYAEDPEGDGPPSAISAVYLYDHPGFGSGGEDATAGCMFMATDYDPEDDIVNGYAWFPNDSGLTSEHGSMLGSDLARFGGRVSNYESGSITFGDCVRRELPPSRFEAYRAVQGQSFYNE